MKKSTIKLSWIIVHLKLLENKVKRVLFYFLIQPKALSRINNCEYFHLSPLTCIRRLSYYNAVQHKSIKLQVLPNMKRKVTIFIETARAQRIAKISKMFALHRLGGLGFILIATTVFVAVSCRDESESAGESWEEKVEEELFRLGSPVFEFFVVLFDNINIRHLDSLFIPRLWN